MTNKVKKGFTLIEIVIVLAIAALILVVVFFAVAGAQRGQRNDAKKNLAARTLSQYNNYLGNKTDGTPALFATAGTYDVSYIPAAERQIQGGTAFTLNSSTVDSSAATQTCDQNATTYTIGQDSGSNNRVAVRICTETAATTANSGIYWYAK